MKLETARLTLHEFTPELDASVQEYAVDEEVYRYQHWGPNTLAETRAYVQFAIKTGLDTPRRTFELAVSLKGGLHIGGARIAVQNVQSGVADIGYTLRRDEWGKGYGTELAAALLQFGFGELKLHRIWATVDPENFGSQRVLEKCGMKRQGLLRENLLVRGKWRDHFLYAVLAHEFSPQS